MLRPLIFKGVRMESKDFLAEFNKCVENKPCILGEANSLYNIACALALQGHLEAALENLQRAIELDPEKYREIAKTDSDFDSIRDDERFQSLIREG
ncbi:MAG: tetratricopeptide repeat protein [Okeania sp. SIO2H7]|nr:tetratricopeptide repeat protein [Okeania sp. SIO2H7]